MNTGHLTIDDHNVHVREMIARIHWLVRLRWGFTAALGLVAAGALAGLLPVPIDGRWFVLVTLLLLVSNVFFHHRSRGLDSIGITEKDLRRHCRGEILFDYLALALVVHALGGVETPILFMIIPNVMIASLFFPREQSLPIVLWGMTLAASPVLLALSGLIEPVTLFPGGGFAHQPDYILAYLAVYAGSVLFSWHIISHIAASLIDTELRLERNYREMLDLDAAKTRAIVQGAHELKSPLAAIRGYVHTLEGGYAGELPEKARELVQRIGERCDRLLAQITDIVRLSNLRSYLRTTGQFAVIDLGAVLREAAEEARRNATGRCIGIDIDAPVTDVMNVEATREHLLTLLESLLANAVNYSHDGGTVTVGLERQGQVAVVTIEDRGIGIPKADLPHVFDEHYRARNAIGHSPFGTGLGLAIARETARIIGAGIAIESEEGRGTRVRLTIPLVP